VVIHQVAIPQVPLEEEGVVHPEVHHLPEVPPLVPLEAFLQIWDPHRVGL
jgi:hypothetical protein